MNRELVLVFVGFRGHWADGVSPIIGEVIERTSNVKVYYCNQREIEKVYNELKKYDKKKYFVISFDVGIGTSDSKYIFQSGIKPASLIIENQNISLGEVGCVINLKGVATIEDFTTNANGKPSRLQLKKRNKIIKSTLRAIQGLIRISEEEDVL